MNDHPYMETEAGVHYRRWKHLGPVWPSMDIAYAMDTIGELDLDREAELRAIALQFVENMRALNQVFVEGALAELQDWPRRGQVTVLGFTSLDPAISQHVYRQLAAPRH